MFLYTSDLMFYDELQEEDSFFEHVKDYKNKHKLVCYSYPDACGYIKYIVNGKYKEYKKRHEEFFQYSKCASDIFNYNKFIDSLNPEIEEYEIEEIEETEIEETEIEETEIEEIKIKEKMDYSFDYINIEECIKICNSHKLDCNFNDKLKEYLNSYQKQENNDVFIYLVKHFPLDYEYSVYLMLLTLCNDEESVNLYVSHNDVKIYTDIFELIKNIKIDNVLLFKYYIIQNNIIVNRNQRDINNST